MRNLRPLSLLLFAALLLAVHNDSRADPLNVPRGAEMLAAAALDGLPGTAAVGTLRDSVLRVAVRGARGSREPVFEIGSVSKIFTGLLLAQAVEAGDLRLEQTLGELLAGQVRFESRAARAITLRQLVTHTSCLRGLPEDPNLVPAASQMTSYEREDLWRALGSVRLAGSPPCASRYSNFGFAVIGELLAQRAGRSWHDLVRTRITGPLGMNDTGPGGEDRLTAGFVREVPADPWRMKAFAGAGGLRSTATDLLVFSRELMAGRTGLLGPAAERVVADLEGYGSAKARIGYAVILPASSHPVWAHNGITGGHVAEWIVWPTRREAVVMLVSNLASPARGIARSLIQGGS